MNPQPGTSLTDDAFTELDRAECLELLEGRHTGRIAWQAPDGPSILPVSYLFRAGTIYLRTSATGQLSTLARHSRVAFEIDGIDERAGVGWSVLVRGSVERVHGDFLRAALWADGPVPWARGRTLFLEIVPESVSGRRLRAV